MKKKDKSFYQGTRELLLNGILKLMEEKLLSEITVMELCEVSGISRRTFYRHYKNTMELFEEVINMTLSEFKEAMAFSTPKSLSMAFYEFWYSKKDLIKLMTRNGLIQMIFLPSLKVFIEVKGREMEKSEKNKYLIYQFGGLWSLLVYTINSDTPLTSKEISDITRR